MLARLVHFTVKGVDLREHKFQATVSGISRRGVQMSIFTEACWLDMS